MVRSEIGPPLTEHTRDILRKLGRFGAPHQRPPACRMRIAEEAAQGSSYRSLQCSVYKGSSSGEGTVRCAIGAPFVPFASARSSWAAHQEHMPPLARRLQQPFQCAHPPNNLCFEQTPCTRYHPTLSCIWMSGIASCTAPALSYLHVCVHT